VKPTIDHDEPANEGERVDWSASTSRFAILWGIPIAAIIFTNFGLVNPNINALILASSLFWMGMGCVWNARSCGRRHCFYTGPWFLIVSFIPLLEAANIIDFTTSEWNFYSSTTLIGAVLLWIIPEKLWGKYR
jgi:hypothetical protein